MIFELCLIKLSQTLSTFFSAYWLPGQRVSKLWHGNKSSSIVIDLIQNSLLNHRFQILIVLFVNLVRKFETTFEVQIRVQQAVDRSFLGFDFSYQGPVFFRHRFFLESVNLSINLVFLTIFLSALLHLNFSELVKIIVNEIFFLIIFILLAFLCMFGPVLSQFLVSKLWIVFHLLVLIRLHLLFIQLLPIKANIIVTNRSVLIKKTFIIIFLSISISISLYLISLYFISESIIFTNFIVFVLIYIFTFILLLPTHFLIFLLLHFLLFIIILFPHVVLAFIFSVLSLILVLVLLLGLLLDFFTPSLLDLGFELFKRVLEMLIDLGHDLLLSERLRAQSAGRKRNRMEVYDILEEGLLLLDLLFNVFVVFHCCYYNKVNAMILSTDAHALSSENIILCLVLILVLALICVPACIVVFLWHSNILLLILLMDRGVGRLFLREDLPNTHYTFRLVFEMAVDIMGDVNGSGEVENLQEDIDTIHNVFLSKQLLILYPAFKNTVHSGEQDINLDGLDEQEQEEEQQDAPIKGCPSHVQDVCIQEAVNEAEDVLHKDGQGSDYHQTGAQQLQQKPALLYFLIWGLEGIRQALTHCYYNPILPIIKSINLKADQLQLANNPACMQLILGFLLVVSAICQTNEESEQEVNWLMTFDQFILKFEKKYSNEGQGAEEYLRRKAIFQENVKDMRENPCETCGINFFTDMTDQEFQQYKGLIPYPQKYIIQGTPTRFSNMDKVGLPYRLNWADRNVITSVKNQGNCGTCWSFATIAMCQSSLILKEEADSSIDLSEQYLLDCTQRSTCSGGYLFFAAQSAVQGVPYQDEWPYQQKKTNRNCDSIRKRIKPANTFQFYTKLNDEQIKELLVNGPVAVAVSSGSWKNYVGGIHYCGKNEEVDHAVLLVGYDENGWILKNQWGDWWGEDGYIRVGYGQNDCRLGEEVISLSQTTYRFAGIVILCLMVLAIMI